MVQEIDKSELAKKIKSIFDVTLINTLPEDRFPDTKIPSSINISVSDDEFVDRVSAAVTNIKGSDIVVYGEDGNCQSSTSAAEKLAAAGFTKVARYSGGYRDWHPTA